MRRRSFLWIVLAFSVSLSGCELEPTGQQIPYLMSPKGMTNQTASAKNNEGVDHLVQAHYEISEKFFREAIAAKNNFAEAHFNLGVALDGMGEHEEAAEAFRKANEFGSENPKITGNELLKKHLGM